MTSPLAQAKRTVWQALMALPGPDFADTCAALLSHDCAWHGPHPINTLVGPQAVAQQRRAGVGKVRSGQGHQGLPDGVFGLRQGGRHLRGPE